MRCRSTFGSAGCRVWDGVHFRRFLEQFGHVEKIVMGMMMRTIIRSREGEKEEDRKRMYRDDRTGREGTDLP